MPYRTTLMLTMLMAASSAAKAEPQDRVKTRTSRSNNTYQAKVAEAIRSCEAANKPEKCTQLQQLSKAVETFTEAAQRLSKTRDQFWAEKHRLNSAKLRLSIAQKRINQIPTESAAHEVTR